MLTMRVILRVKIKMGGKKIFRFLKKSIRLENRRRR